MTVFRVFDAFGAAVSGKISRAIIAAAAVGAGNAGGGGASSMAAMRGSRLR